TCSSNLGLPVQAALYNVPKRFNSRYRPSSVTGRVAKRPAAIRTAAAMVRPEAIASFLFISRSLRFRPCAFDFVTERADSGSLNGKNSMLLDNSPRNWNRNFIPDGDRSVAAL